MTGDITKETAVSIYQPSEAVKTATEEARDDYARGEEILHTSYQELNGYSPIERKNKDDRTFQSFVDESVDNPAEAWKWIGTRSLARKKAWAMHAHMTANFVIPQVFPQNSSQDEDRQMAEVGRDLVEWTVVNSNYRSQYLLAAMGLLVSPVTYMEVDYLNVYQTIWDKQENGNYSKKEILDEIYSGTNCRTLSIDQVLITNAYEQSIQRQRGLVKRRWVEKQELEAKYGEHENWDYVQSGVNSVFNDEDGLFYDVVDEDHKDLVLEVTHLNRRKDKEICYLGGVYMGNQNVDWNPIRHRDNRNAPKYNVVPFGYHRVNEHFFYYASMMFEVGWDDKLIDAMYQTVMNREFLDLEQPKLISGIEGNVDTGVTFPGAVITTNNPDARVQSLVPPRATNAYNALREIEDSMSEATISETQGAQLPDASQKATTIAAVERNAKILLSGSMKNLGESVAQLGYLLLDNALQHLTTAEVDEISGGLKYREFVLENQMVDGRKVSKKIRFDEALMGKKMNDEERMEYNMKLLEEAGYPDSKQAIYVLNPLLFSKMRYLVRIEPDEMMPKNEEFDRIIMERLYQLLRQDPLIDPETLVRELVHASRPRNADNLIAKRNEGQLNPMNISQIIGGGKLPGLPNNAMSGLPA